MDNKLLATFFLKTSEILDALNITENKEEIVKNLVSSLLVNFSKLLATDEKTAPILEDYSQAADVDSNKLFDFLNSKNVDYESFFDQAQKETLQSFVSELGSNVTPEKAEELNKIILA